MITNTLQVVEFIKNVAVELDIAPGHTHFAAVGYSNFAQKYFNFLEYVTEPSLLEATNRIIGSIVPVSNTATNDIVHHTALNPHKTCSICLTIIDYKVKQH